MTGPDLGRFAGVASQPWREDAACARRPSRWWDDDPATATADEREAAEHICRGCCVRLDCLRDALDLDERHTLRGGLSAAQRLDLKRREAGAA